MDDRHYSYITIFIKIRDYKSKLNLMYSKVIFHLNFCAKFIMLLLMEIFLSTNINLGMAHFSICDQQQDH
jgi:hypothetical protein